MRLGDADAVYVSNGSIRNMAGLLRSEGIDAGRALENVPISTIAMEQTGVVTGRQNLLAQRQFVRCTLERRDLWMQLGLRYRNLTDGYAGLAILSAPTLTHVADVASWSLDLSHSLSSFKPIIENGVTVGIRHDLSEVPEDLRDFTIYHDAAGGIVSLRELMPDGCDEISIHLPVDDHDCDRLRALGNWRQIVAGSELEFRWPAELADVGLPHADEVTHGHFREKCHDLLDEYRGKDFISRLSVIIREDISRADLPHVASLMFMSVRTLQRRLDNAGISFRRLVDELRLAAAKAQLGKDTSSISTIAYRLGYTDQASFNRAFRRWTGMTPSDYRRAHIA